MAIVPFLAMTAAEIGNLSCFPQRIAWMACHFSPYGLGLSNFPKELPPGTLLIVDDVTPPHSHDPILIASQLSQCAEEFQCCGVLLDFQRTGCAETATLTQQLLGRLSCPVAVSEPYAVNLECPVFLSPVPPSVPLTDYLRPWSSREIWLEIGMEGESLTLTEAGCRAAPLPCPDLSEEGFEEKALHCHYAIRTDDSAARFTLWRTQEDLQALLEEAETLGVTGTVGLFQELHGFAEP